MEISNKVTDLPSEILTQIFKQIPKETQVACQYVCKSWYYPAQQRFYDNISVMGRKDTKLQKLLYCLHNSSAGDMVKYLTIKQDGGGLDREEFVAVVKSCPKIQELALCNNPNYFMWLYEEGDTIKLNNLLTLTSVDGMTWRTGEKIPYFYRSVHKYRKSIQKLQIPCSCSSVIQQQYGSIFDYLSSFPKLTHLIMIDGSQKVMVYFHTLLDACPGLEKLVTRLGHPLFDPATTADHHKITTYPTLYDLDIFLPKFSIEYFRYIMQRCVNMKNFRVEINQSNEDWNSNKEEIRQFMRKEYVPFVKKLASSFLAIKTNRSTSIDDLFMESLNMDGEAKTVSYFDIHDSRAESTDVMLDRTNHQGTLCSVLQYSLVRDLSSYDTVDLPYVKHLSAYGKGLDTLHINLSDSVRQVVDLGFILNKCPNLEELEINISQRSPRQYSWNEMMQTYNSMPNLYLEEEDIISACNNLSILTLSGCMITSSLLNTVSTKMPNLRLLDMLNCSYDIESIANLKVLRFDMSQSNLKQLTFDASFFCQPREEVFFIITTEKTGKSYYYVLDQQLDDGSFFHISRTYTSYPTTVKYPLIVEFIFYTIDTIEMHIEKFHHQQHIKKVFFPDNSATVDYYHSNYK